MKNITKFYHDDFLNADENIFNGINAQQCNSSQINEGGRCCYISIYTDDDVYNYCQIIEEDNFKDKKTFEDYFSNYEENLENNKEEKGEGEREEEGEETRQPDAQGKILNEKKSSIRNVDEKEDNKKIKKYKIDCSFKRFNFKFIIILISLLSFI